MGPLLALRKALYSALSTDTALVALLGGVKIYAMVPPATEPPYISFGEARITLWTGGSRSGHTHHLVLDIWSLQTGDVEMLTLAERITQIVSTAPLTPEGCVVLHCFVETLTCYPPHQNGWRQARLELRALTEQQD